IMSIPLMIFFCLYLLDMLFQALNFPRDSQDGYGRVNMMFPTLPAVSVCVRVQWDPQWDQVSTMYSYAAPVFTNEFQLRGQVDRTGRILLALIVHGQHLPYKASFPNDGAWHHLCVTWRKADGHWAIYVDGERGAMGSRTDTPRDIHGEGILILGQDQDSFGGNFTEPFIGNITDLNVWNTSLEQRQFRALNESWGRGNWFAWPVLYEENGALLNSEKQQNVKPSRKRRDSISKSNKLTGFLLAAILSKHFKHG
uniref:Pentraxin (PTX) domain-containing protein n=1 Tax=Hucho hucho TaxID=62062 RepID=A0A4W5NDY0_9TELE